MLDYDAADESLLSFYDLPTLHPTRLSDVELKQHPTQFYDLDEVAKMPLDEQFGILNEVVNRQYQPFLVSRKPEDYTKDDVEDPLQGKGSNVVQTLLSRRAISSQNDPEINHYIITSQQFDASKFLTTVHNDSSIDDLTRYLGILDRLLKLQRGSVQRVIDNNFEQFVDIKKRIDTILVGFRQTKTKVGTERDATKVYMPLQGGVKDDLLSAQLEDLIKNLNTTLALMIRPIKENTDRELKLGQVIEFIRLNQFLFDLPQKLLNNIAQNRHDEVVDDYNEYILKRELFTRNHEQQYQADRAEAEGDAAKLQQVEELNLLVLTVANKLFDNVDNIIHEYRKRIYRQLLALDHQVTLNTYGRAIDLEKNPNSKFISLVDKIYQLDPDKKSNPISQFLRAQVDGLHHELEHQLTKFDDKFKMMQAKLKSHIGSLLGLLRRLYVRYIAEKYLTIETYFQTNLVMADPEHTVTEVFEQLENLDLSVINETWLVLFNFIDYLDDIYRKNVAKFVTNYTHYGGTQNIEDVDPEGQIRALFDQLITRTVDILLLIFDDEDQANLADQVPENYSQFMPYYLNSLLAMYYLLAILNKLSRFLTSLGKFVGSVGEVYKSAELNRLVKLMRNCAARANQRIVEALGTVWVNDCLQFYELEQWDVLTIPIEGEDPHFDGANYTKLMNIITYYHGFVLTKIGQLLFTKNDKGAEIRIVPLHPLKKTLVGVEIQFMRCLNITLDSIMKKYNNDRKDDNSAVYKILTMNNFDVLLRLVYPILIRKFDTLFDKDLQQQNLPIFANIDRASLTIFDDVILKQKLVMNARISQHFNLGVEPRELKVDGFIYDILMEFVKLIHRIKPLTGTEIFISIVNELQQGVLKSVLDNMRAHPDMSAVTLANLKLDVNFFMEVFENSKTLKINETAFRIIEILLNSIQERLGDAYDQQEWDDVLEENLRVSANQFDCF